MAAQCDVMLVIGTSAIVHPAAAIPMVARQGRAKVIEVNPEPTPLTEEGISHYLVQGKAGDVMNRIVTALQARL